MLKNDDWWVNHEYAPTHAARVSGETYSALMVKMATQEQEKMRQQRVEENRVASIKRRARTSAALRAETHNLLAHCPDAWWSLLRGGPRNDAMTPPTAIVVLTPDAASALKRLCRSLLKGHHTNRAAEIDEMLLDAAAALQFSTRRKEEGPAAALTIQRLAYQFLARQRVRLLIFDRWEKRWNDNQQAYSYVDKWAEKASQSRSNYWAEEDDAPFVAPPWPIKSRDPPEVLRKKRFNVRATPEATMGTPRGVARKLANEGEDHGALLERERGVRERAAAADRRRDAHVHDLCCLEATMAAIRAAAVGLAPQWNSGADRDDLYATPPTVSEPERERERTKERKKGGSGQPPTNHPPTSHGAAR